ncbi:hypothetical protein M5689_003413 [Euphorbia peplus]|nr:hypothetical protein M5689_003413 [Euphorbia peplus]
MDAPMMCQEEGSGETDGGQRGKSICRILNCESFIPCPVIDGIRHQGKAEDLLRHEGEGLEKQRRGQPKNKSKCFRRGNSGLKKSIFILD